MKTISVKELLDNLDDIVRCARRGESIKGSYRSRVAFVIQPDESVMGSTGVPGSRLAMQEFISQVRRINQKPRHTKLDPSKTIKELYHDMLNADGKFS